MYTRYLWVYKCSKLVMYNKKIHVIDTESKLFKLFCMFLKDWIKELSPWSINRSILESTNVIIKVIDIIQQDNAIVVIVN